MRKAHKGRQKNTLIPSLMNAHIVPVLHYRLKNVYLLLTFALRDPLHVRVDVFVLMETEVSCL